MKLKYLAALVFLLTPLSLFAQSTTVSGQVTDAGSQTWNNGTYTIAFVQNPQYQPQPPYTWTGGALTITFTGTLSATGAYSLSLPSNSAITPQGSKWQFQFCPQASSPCFVAPNVTVTGATQTVNATPPAIAISIAQSSQNIVAYSTSEIASVWGVGAQFYLIGSGLQTCSAISGSTCTTWVGAGGASGVVGGTFGASPSSGYTFTSTPITTAPFSGNLLVATATEPTGNVAYTAGSGWTLDLAGNSGFLTIGMEHQIAGSSLSYTGNFTLASTQVWGSTITTFTATNPALVQAKQATATTLAYTSNNAAGNLLFAVIRYASGSTGPVTGVTCNSNTWQLAGLRALEGATKAVGNGNVEEIWFAPNSNAGACTVTPAGVTGASVEIAAAEFSGVATSNPLVDYNYNPDGTGNTLSTNVSGATTNTQYTINAVNNVTGVVSFTGRDSGAVFRSATNATSATGGLLYFKNGFYPGQTSLQESVAGQTNWYVWGIAAPTGSQIVGWRIVCESVTSFDYPVLETAGCIHQIMPSAYSGPAPSGTQLSGFWQRPNATLGAKANNADYIVNGACRIPDNQRSATTCVDLFTTLYSSHIGIVADTTLPAGSQSCSNLTPALANIIGFRSNQPGTDEAYFENTWAVGYNTPYSVLSNHPLGLNVHSVCNQNAGNFTVSASVYGGLLNHFQDIHNVNGLILGCTSPGTRFDLPNTIIENLSTGLFTRNTDATESNAGNCTGKVDVTTAIVGGGTTYHPFFAAGSGANFQVTESGRLILPGKIFSNFTSSPTTGTTKQTLATYTFVDNPTALGPNYSPFNNNSGAVYEIVTWGHTATNGDSKTLEIDFGGTAIATITSTVSNGTIRCKARLIVSSVANTQVTENECDDGTTRTVADSAPGITSSANIVMNVAATTATASGDFTHKGTYIIYLGGQ